MKKPCSSPDMKYDMSCPFNPGDPRQAMEKLFMQSQQTVVPKDWGHEVWFANTDDYCGKLLYIKKGLWSSNGKFHYHKIKDETFFVIDGTLELVWVDESNAGHTVILQKHESFRVMPGVKHKFSSISPDGCHFIEASTTHREDDSYRCEFIDGKWVE